LKQLFKIKKISGEFFIQNEDGQFCSSDEWIPTNCSDISIVADVLMKTLDVGDEGEIVLL